MNRMSEAAVGGSGRRRTSGDAAVTKARAEGIALLSIGEAPRALARRKPARRPGSDRPFARAGWFGAPP